MTKNKKSNHDKSSYTIDSTTIDAGSIATFDTTNCTITTTGTTIYTYEDPIGKRFENIERSLDDIKERLAIIDDPDPELLKKKKMLREAYNKYKMIEKLLGEQKDSE